MKNKLKSLIALTLIAGICRSQNLYTLANYGNQVKFHQVNTSSFSLSAISSTAILSGPNYYYSTIDPVNKRIFFTAYNDTIYTGSLINGSIISRVSLSPDSSIIPVSIQYNCYNSTLYAISKNTVSNKLHLTILNPGTGTQTLLTSSGIPRDPAFNVYSYNRLSSLDPLNNYYFYYSHDTLYTFNLQNGNVIARNRIFPNSSGALKSLAFNKSNSTLFAIKQPTSSNQNYPVKVNPLTGSVTPISISPLQPGNQFFPGHFTLDETTNKLLYMTTGDTINSFDLTTGNMISRNRLSNAPPSEYVILLEFDNSCSAITKLNSFDKEVPAIFISPNPNKGEFTITFSEIQNSQIDIFNSMGQIVHKQNQTGTETKIDLSEFPNGIYFCKLHHEKGSITKKILKE